MANSYAKGQLVRCTGTFTNADSGAYVDPTTVTFRTKDPSGDLGAHVYGVDPNVIRSSTGQYYYDLDLDEAGEWDLRWESTGTHQGAQEWSVYCCPPADGTW